MFANMYEFTARKRPSISQFTICSFQPFPEEESCMAELQDAIFQYMLIKEAKLVEKDLPGLTSVLGFSGWEHQRV